MRNFKRLSPFFIILVLLMSGAKPPTEGQKPKGVELRGKIVCLAEEMHTHYKVELFGNHEHLYGVKTKDGEYYTLLRTSLAEALFVDERLHEKGLGHQRSCLSQDTIAGGNPLFVYPRRCSPRSLLLLRYMLYPYGCAGKLRLLSGTGRVD